MSSKIAKKVITIVCDDIRHENGNKDSLMGVYDADIVFDNLPALLQRLSFAVYLTKIKEVLKNAEFSFTLPHSEPKKIQLNKLGITKMGENAKLHLTVGHLEVTDTGKAKAEIIFNGDKKLKIVHEFEIIERDAK